MHHISIDLHNTEQMNKILSLMDFEEKEVDENRYFDAKDGSALN
jgi:hypothetical protein